MKPASAKIPFANWVYVGPGVAEWMLAFGCTGLIAGSFQSLSAFNEPQSAEGYYAQLGYPLAAQYMGLGICLLILASIALLFFRPAWTSTVISMISGIAFSAIGLVWTELILAHQVQQKTVKFLLSDLPYRPVALYGIVGAQIFLTYLIFKAPSQRLNGGASFAIKAGLSLCAWLMQLMAWQLISGRGTL